MDGEQKNPLQSLRRFSFTHNHYTEDDVKRYMDPASLHPWIDYIIFGYEICPTTKTPHLQGYVEFDRPQPLARACDKMEPGKGKGKNPKPHSIWMKAALKNRDANVNYVRKKESKDPAFMDDMGNPIIFEWQKPGTERTRGAGTGAAVWAERLEDIKQEPDLLLFAEKHPEVAFKYSSGIAALCEALKTSMTEERVALLYPKKLRLYRWQRSLVKILMRPDILPEGRKIIWIYDPLGACGKTVISAWLMVNCGALYLNNAKSEHMAHAWSATKSDIVVIDLMKTTEDYVNYTAMEALKNGLIFDSKWHSSSKISIRPWVIVMSNMLPKLDAMAQERFSVYPIRNNPRSFELEDDPTGELVPFNISDRTSEFLDDDIFGPCVLGQDEWEKRQAKIRESLGEPRT